MNFSNHNSFICANVTLIFNALNDIIINERKARSHFLDILIIFDAGSHVKYPGMYK